MGTLFHGFASMKNEWNCVKKNIKGCNFVDEDESQIALIKSQYVLLTSCRE